MDSHQCQRENFASGRPSQFLPAGVESFGCRRLSLLYLPALASKFTADVKFTYTACRHLVGIRNFRKIAAPGTSAGRIHFE